ncbi:cation/H(+) antiporter 2-like [Dendrobium catenatum]|uniref:cation/H(+) antiporter 2-like n=1 Tax=Dendrobium catenatum TaxID=906689 RepID=UPI00109FD739|nr:cation/H(+) antiporter 2-like [Dendrobium catenatum]
MMMGPTMTSKIKILRELFAFGSSNTKLMGSIAITGRMFFMLLVGLEMDIPFLLRSVRRSIIITTGSAVSCFIAAISSSTIIYRATGPNGNPLLFLLILALLYTNTSSTIVIRMCTELKLATSDLGRLAVSSSLLNDMACLLVLAVATTTSPGPYNQRTQTQKLIGGLTALLMLTISAWVLKPLVRWMNKRNEGRRHIRHLEMVGLLLFVFIVAVMMEMMGYNSTMACFMLGLVMPREGCTVRTLVDKLSYPINKFVLPIFFGFAGISTDMSSISGGMMGAVVVMVVLNIAAKVVGTLAATRYLGMAVYEGIVLGFLLNIKGHVDLVLVSLARGAEVRLLAIYLLFSFRGKLSAETIRPADYPPALMAESFRRKFGQIKHRNSFQENDVLVTIFLPIWGEEAQKVLLVTVLMATLAAGPAAAFVIRLERSSLRYRGAYLHHHPIGAELRILTCIHGPRDVPTMLNLVEICGGGAPESPLAAYLMHLVELTAGAASYVLYHQHDVEDDGGWEHGGDDARIITAAADVFSIETGIGLRQVTVVSAMETMQEDVYNATVDVRASLVLMPFHKHQRVDGRMQVGKIAVQQLNERVMKRIPCTVGVLVDRGLDGSVGGHTPTNGPNPHHPMHQVAVLFFGGADDREALAVGMRLALHPSVLLTVIRFLPESRAEHDAGLEMAAANDDKEVLVAISNHEREMEADEAFMATFMSRSMSTGRAMYVEKYVRNAAETVAVICAMDNMYSLFIVGRGRDRLSPLTRGMNQWVECPELGSVGDLLASCDFMGVGSVLVVRQYSNHLSCKNDDGEDDEDIDEEFKVF